MGLEFPCLPSSPADPEPRHERRTRARLASFLGLTALALSLVGSLPTAATAATIELRTPTSANDAEESATGTVSLTSTTLQLVFDTSNQTVGMRWTGLTIPPGSTITAAYIQFNAAQSQSEVTNLVFQGQAADNPPVFSTAAGSISARPRTAASASWAPVAWVTNEVGANERTPSLSAMVQEVVSRPGWASGNAIAIIVTGTGHRTAWSFDGKRAKAPLLHIEYTPPDFPPLAKLAVSQVATPPLTVSASAAGSTDTDLTPIASYQFDFGDGTPVVTTNAPGLTAQHTYAAAGSYTVTLTATDTANLTSAPVSVALTVQPDAAPVASLSATQLASPALTVSASGSGSTDADLTPIASYHFDFGDGTPVVNTTAPTAAAQHTYAAAGAYTVTLTVTDTGGLTSSPVTSPVTVNPPPEAAPVASLSVTQLASPALTVSANGSGSTDADLTPIASYQFDFGDGSPIVTTTAPTSTAQHTYAVAGSYTVALTATDTGSNTSAPATATINVTSSVGPPTIVEKRTVASSDDAEEFATTSMYLDSSDLELIHDSSDQIVGMRWTGLGILPGSTITAAYIQFAAKESQSEVTNLTLRAQAADDPATFTTTAGNVSTRPRTSASTAWTPVAWNAGQAGTNQRTPDLSAAIQEVVSRPGWASGNALVMIVNGTGHRTAWAWDGNAAAAPLLHVEYQGGIAPDLPPTAQLAVTQLQSPALSVNANGSGSTDTDATPIASYQFNFGDGGPVVTTTAPTSTAQHTYAAAGYYTVTLIATDTGGKASAPASFSLTVSATSGPQVAVFAGYYDTHHAINPQPKPNPWKGSTGVVFVGQQDNKQGDPPGGGWDSSCLRLDNLTTSTLTGVTVTVDMGTYHYALWGSQSIPVGGHLILAQTAFENFDGSDTNPAGCYGCDPAECLTLISSTVPVVHVTINGTTTHYYDTGQVLNTDGADAAGCPYVGGQLPQTRYDESENWVQIYPPGGAPPSHSEPAGSASLMVGIDQGTLMLAPPAPNPSRGDTWVRFATPQNGPVRVDLYDLQGRLVRPCIYNVLHAGAYRFQLDLGDVHPGVYFVNLWTPQASRHEKLVLMH